jgi:hypothetical protein
MSNLKKIIGVKPLLIFEGYDKKIEIINTILIYIWEVVRWFESRPVRKSPYFFS